MKAVRSLWLLVVLMLLGGYGLIVQPGEQAINAMELRARTLYDEANENESKIRRSSQLEQVRRRVQWDLRKLSGQAAPAATTAVLLRLLNDDAKRFNLEIRAVTPDRNTAPSVTSSLDFSETDWSIGLRGRFRDVVAFVTDLPKHNALLYLRDVELTSTSNEPAAAPWLNVTLHAQLYHLAALSFLEDTHGTAFTR